jgi:hypothetical protein
VDAASTAGLETGATLLSQFTDRLLEPSPAKAGLLLRSETLGHRAASLKSAHWASIEGHERAGRRTLADFSGPMPPRYRKG